MPRRPSFILFITDQHRADHLGCYGNPVVRSPHIDGIAAHGCVFENFHVATPLCQPNRASLMTSRMPSLHGVRMNGRELSLGELTFVDMLRQAGYRTGLVGKAHLQNITDMPAAWPGRGEARLSAESRRPYPGRYGQERGSRWEGDPQFDLSLPYYGFEKVFLTIGHADEQQGHWRRWLRAQTAQAESLIGFDNALPTPDFVLSGHRQAWRTRVPEELYPTQYIAQRCCELLADYAKGAAPFFLQCSFPDPHHPYTPPGRFWDMFRPEDMALPPSFDATLIDPPPPITALRRAAQRGQARKTGHGTFACTAREAQEALALNFGSIACIDEAVGRVLGTLRSLGLDDDTVLLFTSDHGDMLGDRGVMLKGGMHYRPLIRVPFLWRDTRQRRRAARTAALAQTIDIAATVLDRAGVRPANGMQGRSLMAPITGTASQVRPHLVVEEEGQRQDFDLAHRPRLRSLVTSRHRLTLYAQERWGELYDLANDPMELRNLWNDPTSSALRADLVQTLALAMVEASDDSPYPECAA